MEGKDIENISSDELKLFQSEIKRLKEIEAQAGKTAHFLEINPDNLNIDDMVIWRKIEGRRCDLENFLLYKNSIPETETDRKKFSAYLANRFMILDIENEDLN